MLLYFAFFPQVMKTMCMQGYKDALHFLKKNGEEKRNLHISFTFWLY